MSKLRPASPVDSERLEEALVYQQQRANDHDYRISAEQIAEMEVLMAELEAGTLEFATDEEVEQMWAKLCG
jgi:hypothetical protein